jgi:hypothetical protein
MLSNKGSKGGRKWRPFSTPSLSVATLRTDTLALVTSVEEGLLFRGIIKGRWCPPSRDRDAVRCCLLVTWLAKHPRIGQTIAAVMTDVVYL